MPLLREAVVYRFLWLLSRKEEVEKEEARLLFEELCRVLAGDSRGCEVFFEALGLGDRASLEELANALRYKLPSLAGLLCRQLKATFTAGWQPLPPLHSMLTDCQFALLKACHNLFEGGSPTKLYDSLEDGRSINAIAGKAAGYPARWMILVRHAAGMFGAVQHGLY